MQKTGEVGKGWQVQRHWKRHYIAGFDIFRGFRAGGNAESGGKKMGRKKFPPKNYSKKQLLWK